VELNLQNHSLTYQPSNRKEEETYIIPTIINGRILRKDTSKVIKQRPPLQKNMKLNTTKKTVTSACRRHKILIIGDSHVRGLSEKISNCLDDSFSVTGITKPNADIEAITSPLHLKTEGLTKNDLIIFYGVTKDISRNETKKGLRSLMGFAQRTINTNVILLGAPHRYDLPPSSYVNTEVKLYHKKLQSLMSTSNHHVRVLSVPTERRHHTKHGLHLNTKRKDWIVNNIVEEIRNLYLPCKISPPIVLPWRDVKENLSQLAQPNKDRYWPRSDPKDDFGNQVLPVTENDTECPSPSCRSDDYRKFGDSAIGVDSQRLRWSVWVRPQK
jgi:hypothetical protein